jgi:hypothetical protein
MVTMLKLIRAIWSWVMVLFLAEVLIVPIVIVAAVPPTFEYGEVKMAGISYDKPGLHSSWLATAYDTALVYSADENVNYCAADGLFVQLAEFLAAETGSNIVGQNFGKLGTVVENPSQTITGFTDHGFTQADVRGLTWNTMQSTVQQPSVVLQQSAGQYLYVSPNSAVVLNPAGQIMTTYPSSMFGTDIQALLKAASAGH